MGSADTLSTSECLEYIRADVVPEGQVAQHRGQAHQGEANQVLGGS